MKLLGSSFTERKCILILGFEHTPPVISLEDAISSFELLAHHVLGVRLSARIEEVRTGLIHPVHQQLTVFGYEVEGRI